MTAQVYWEDIQEGAALPTLTKHPTTRQLVEWSGASGGFGEIHYDKDVAQSRGLPGVIVQGRHIASMLAQLASDLAGEWGWVKKLTYEYRGMNYPGQDMFLKGKVLRKFTEDNAYYVECDLWAETEKREATTRGKAIVMLPSRKQLPHEISKAQDSWQL